MVLSALVRLKTKKAGARAEKYCEESPTLRYDRSGLLRGCYGDWVVTRRQVFKRGECSNRSAWAWKYFCCFLTLLRVTFRLILMFLQCSLGVGMVPAAAAASADAADAADAAASGGAYWGSCVGYLSETAGVAASAPTAPAAAATASCSAFRRLSRCMASSR